MYNIYGNTPANYTSIPTVVTKKNGGERAFDIFSRIMDDRIIFLGDEVNNDTAQILIAQMLYLESVDPNRDIIMYINSPGGCITSGMAIYDTMNLIKCDVSTVCVGMAASMGAFLLSGGAKGKRYSLPNSEILIHQPLISGGLGGQCTDIKIHSDQLVYVKDKMTRILAENTGKSYDFIAAETERDNYLTPEKALEYGIIDKIITKR